MGDQVNYLGVRQQPQSPMAWRRNQPPATSKRPIHGARPLTRGLRRHLWKGLVLLLGSGAFTQFGLQPEPSHSPQNNAQHATIATTLPLPAPRLAPWPTLGSTGAPTPGDRLPWRPLQSAQRRAEPPHGWQFYPRPTPAPFDAPPLPLTRQATFGKALGFRDALIRNGVAGADADAVIAALGAHMDFRRCRPEDTLSIQLRPDGSLLEFEYRASATERYRARRGVAGFHGETVEVPVTIRRLQLGGHVLHSLGQALDHLGAGQGLVGAFVEAFEHRTSFARDTRTGDRFRILVDERQIDGATPTYGTVHALEYRGVQTGTLRAYWFKPPYGQGDFYDEQGRALKGGFLRTPLRYDHISSPYDPRRMHPVLRRIIPHQGVDYAAPTGTPVWAAGDGVVTFAGRKGPNGNLVAIQHPGGLETFYAHLSRIQPGIRPGVRVRQRQRIGAVGSTGRSTGPHLHFGVKRDAQFQNPTKVLNGPGVPLRGATLQAFHTLRRRLQQTLDTIPLAPAPPDAGPAPSLPPATD